MKDWKKSSKGMQKERKGEHGTMSQALCRVLRDLVCEEQEDPDCRKCPLRNVDCYNMHDNRAMQGVLMELFGSHPGKVKDDEKEECRSGAPESPVTAFGLKAGISYRTDKNKPLRSDF